MLLDVCLEVSGSYAHLVGVDTVHSLFGLRDRCLSRIRRRPVTGHLDGAFEHRLDAAVDRLPLLLAHVLWLVDICGCTYETAAAELGMAPNRVERLVAEARHQLRDELVSGPRRSPEGSTSPFPPVWRPPDR